MPIIDLTNEESDEESEIFVDENGDEAVVFFADVVPAPVVNTPNIATNTPNPVANPPIHERTPEYVVEVLLSSAKDREDVILYKEWNQDDDLVLYDTGHRSVREAIQNLVLEASNKCWEHTQGEKRVNTIWFKFNCARDFDEFDQFFPENLRKKFANTLHCRIIGSWPKGGAVLNYRTPATVTRYTDWAAQNLEFYCLVNNYELDLFN